MKKIQIKEHTFDIKYSRRFVIVENNIAINKTNELRYLKLKYTGKKELFFSLNFPKICWTNIGQLREYAGMTKLTKFDNEFIIQLKENEIVNLEEIFNIRENELLFSIVIPMYNVSKYVDDLLTSFPLNDSRFEVIFIDDKSTDNTLETLIENNHIKNFKVIKNSENIGLGATRNIGIENAIADYIFFLDSDDWLVEGSIDYFVKLILTNKNIDIFIFDDKKHLKFEKILINTSNEKKLLGNNMNLIAYRHMSSCVKLYKKSLFNNILFKENILFEDVFLLVDLYNVNNLNILDTKVNIYCYRQQYESITNQKFGIKDINSYAKLIEYINDNMEYNIANFMFNRIEKHISYRTECLPLEIKNLKEKYNYANNYLFDIFNDKDIKSVERFRYYRFIYENRTIDSFLETKMRSQ